MRPSDNVGDYKIVARGAEKTPDSVFHRPETKSQPIELSNFDDYASVKRQTTTQVYWVFNGCC